MDETGTRDGHLPTTAAGDFDETGEPKTGKGLLLTRKLFPNEMKVLRKKFSKVKFRQRRHISGWFALEFESSNMRDVRTFLIGHIEGCFDAWWYY
jgi:hypothetical protein